MSPQSPGASSDEKVRKSAPLQQTAAKMVLDVVELVEVVELGVAPGRVDDVVPPGTVDVVVAGTDVEVVLAAGTLDEVVVGWGPPPGQTPGAGEREAMKRPVSFRRIVPPN